MSAGIDRLASELQRVLDEKDSKKKTPYDTEAEVVRVDVDTVWVKIPGGIDETPAQRTINAKVGDRVQVRVSGGRAFLVGNGTNPPTDDTKANEASYQAQNAEVHAVNAEGAAADAMKSAETARIDASIAHQMAENASQSADEAAEQANTARESAQSAHASATNALDQLAIVENVVGVLDLLSTHGNYTEITDTEAVAEDGKWYFTRSGEGTTTNPYTYAVANLNVGDSVAGYYELTDIDEAITNYVSSHLALTDDGLSLQQDGSDYRLLISADGLKIIGANGTPVASYGAETTIGSKTGFNVKITGSELGFYQGTQRVAYINNNQLYITQSVVLQQMDLGTPVVSDGLGQWSWKVHPNGKAPSRNNLNLKWIG
jgi:hypothetical protein